MKLNYKVKYTTLTWFGIFEREVAAIFDLLC